MTFRGRSRDRGRSTAPADFPHLRRALAMQLDAVRALAGRNDDAARVAYLRARAIERELMRGEQEEARWTC